MTKLVNQNGEKKIILLEKNIQKKFFVEDFEAGSRNFSLEVIVQGENSEVEIVGRAESKNSDQKKWKISLVLAGKNQKGVLDLKGIADEKGRLEFDGGGVIASKSEEGNISVQEKIVLFSKNAKAKNVPVLTVETENVNSASHSASIAPFDKEVFFFLESRGISPDSGKSLLREGFLEISPCRHEDTK